MTSIGFIGLGNMGGPMARNLVAAGHAVAGFDVVAAALERATGNGVVATVSVAEAAASREVIITMLPAGEHVREVYLGNGGVLANAAPGTLLIDCSTIDVATARDVIGAAAERGFEMLDAPVSGGVGGAEAGTLTFMVGGAASAFERARPLLDIMGGNVFHTGGPGNGQAAKMCNNMILGISMIGVSEAFTLADKVGLDAQTLFDVVATASGQCWALTSYCPVPGPVPTSPANRDYQAGFTADMMLKDLRLAQSSAKATGAATVLGAEAEALYTRYCEGGDGASDFSGIIRMIAERSGV
jgi:3-hydroxyisobutyrate dehydrogenase